MSTNATYAFFTKLVPQIEAIDPSRKYGEKTRIYRNIVDRKNESNRIPQVEK
jgi:hypothetical protein